MSEPLCKHNWTTPPECPHCCAEERDILANELTKVQANLATARSALRRILAVVPTPTSTLSWEQNVALIATEALATALEGCKR